MYENFFGFKENPFRLVPNPTYLFLSRSHEEALAHLKYAIAQGNGFAKITGEVGTGKTTLCRAFLENLDKDTEVAYIFNPKLNSVQLLKSINTEFGIPSDGNTAKALIDTLNAFLMTQNSLGRKVVLLIDEAQNLTPAVLEQIRLLSNLETTQFKLLQIILVGQPELDEMLSSPGLRQLEQRISLSYRLRPLTLEETLEYITHRINIALSKPGVTFPMPAVRAIFAFSRGIPRRINIACDRTLLTAYGMNQQRIQKSHARRAIREINGKSEPPWQNRLRGWKGYAFVFSILSAVLLWVLIRPPKLNRADPVVQSAQEQPGMPALVLMTTPPMPPITEEPVSGKVSPSHALPPVSELPDSSIKPEITGQLMPETPSAAVRNLADLLGRMDSRTSRSEAFRTLMDLWRINAEIPPDIIALEDDIRFFRLAAKQAGLVPLRVTEGLEMVKRLNLPAILAMRGAEQSAPVYLTVTGVKEGQVTVARKASEKGLTVYPDALVAHWDGTAYIPWKDFLTLDGKISTAGTTDAILTLKTLIKDIGFSHIAFSPEYDAATQEAVKKIQTKHGLPPNGIVGPLTTIVLYNDSRGFFIPKFRSSDGPS